MTKALQKVLWTAIEALADPDKFPDPFCYVIGGGMEIVHAATENLTHLRCRDARHIFVLRVKINRLTTAMSNMNDG
jgi:hypothetical protein